jgi:hypothetical protein
MGKGDHGAGNRSPQTVASQDVQRTGSLTRANQGAIAKVNSWTTLAEEVSFGRIAPLV